MFSSTFIVISKRNHKLLSTTFHPSFFIPHPFTDVEQRKEINWNDYT
ncbi:hypothetical protein H1P_870024 [Hyella patelloides LEGE 07179]|uniref:Uncharacterized protein n=1 Tax=Hyella patelloides LEGE 07179 TaxID=945734 RepID=A0A563W4U9_9CYAN|nr:hypothetical protein H1P_870024 [Hyella patelloides LEGE 07179]